VFEAELAFANSLADEAADIALSFFGGDLVVRQKPDRTPVTEADVGVESMIRTRLAARFPSDAVHGEEEGLQGSGPRTWVVDPIDGTKNFTAGIQIWATLIALTADGDPMVGVVSAPALGERYAAARGAGATLNGHPIRVSATPAIEEALVLSDNERSFLGTPDEPWFRELVTRAKRTRAFGDFWAHMLVARGSADVELAPELRLWDYAALVPVVRESGGTITTFDGGPLRDRGSVLTTNGLLHDEVVGRVRSAGARAPSG
jgi:histidinol-phosphatase